MGCCMMLAILTSVLLKYPSSMGAECPDKPQQPPPISHHFPRILLENTTGFISESSPGSSWHRVWPCLRQCFRKCQKTLKALLGFLDLLRPQQHEITNNEVLCIFAGKYGKGIFVLSRANGLHSEFQGLLQQTYGSTCERSISRIKATLDLMRHRFEPALNLLQQCALLGLDENQRTLAAHCVPNGIDRKVEERMRFQPCQSAWPGSRRWHGATLHVFNQALQSWNFCKILGCCFHKD